MGARIRASFSLLIIGLAAAGPVPLPVIQHSLSKARALYSTSRETVIVLAFLTAGKIQSTRSQLNHRKGRAVRAIMVVEIAIQHEA